MAERKLTASIDFDGVVFGRRPRAQMAILKWAFAPWKYNRSFKPKFTEPPIEAAPSTSSLSPNEQREVASHARRQVKEGMRIFLEQLDADVKMGNTGRPNNQPMVSVTEMRLEEGGVLHIFDDIRFKPKGMSSDEGKYWRFVVIKKYGGRFKHYDDNAKLIKDMAPLFPDDEFVIVEDLTSGLLFSRKEMDKHPNVTRIAIDKKGQVKQTYPPLTKTE